MDRDLRFVKFRPTTGSEFTLVVPRNDTILAIKILIQDMVRIPIACQTLSHNGQVLADDLNLPDAFFIDGTFIGLDVHPWTPFFTLFIRLTTGTVITFILPHRSATIGQIKERIQQVRGYPIISQFLVYNDQLLHDDLNLVQTPIFDSSTVDLIVDLLINQHLLNPQPQGHLPLHNPPPGSQLSQSRPQRPFYHHQPQPQLRPPTSSDQEVTSRQQPPQAPADIASGSGTQRQVESMPLQTLPIQTINLTLRIPAFTVFDRDLNLIKKVPKSNQQAPFDKSITIGQIKNKMQEAENVAAERLTLLFNNIVLEDNRSLGSYDIREGSEIYFIVAPFSSPAQASGSGYPGQ